ncbi:MAG: DUF1127 domain-containing protein [Bauldia litoralis]
MSFWIDTIRRPRRTHRSGPRPLHFGLEFATDLFLTWLDRYAQRRQLARLDPRMLKDIGVSQTDALQEARKPFWQA